MNEFQKSERSKYLQNIDHRIGIEKCSVEGCERESKIRGYCIRHYKQIWKYGEIKSVSEKTKYPKICSVEGCERETDRKGYCTKHYYQMYEHGKIIERTIRDPNIFILKENIYEIYMFDKNGKQKGIAIIDKEDYEKIKNYKWYMKGDSEVFCMSLQKHLSRLILDVTDSHLYVDHIDHNRLNNRKSNLRICTNAQNQWNKIYRTRGKTKYTGVYYVPSNKFRKWVARITVNKKTHYLGSYLTPEEADKAYKDACLRFHGEFVPNYDILDSSYKKSRA